MKSEELSHLFGLVYLISIIRILFWMSKMDTKTTSEASFSVPVENAKLELNNDIAFILQSNVMYIGKVILGHLLRIAISIVSAGINYSALSRVSLRFEIITDQALPVNRVRMQGNTNTFVRDSQGGNSQSFARRSTVVCFIQNLLVFGSLSGIAAVQSPAVLYRDGFAPRRQLLNTIQEYTTPGTASFLVPVEVTSITATLSGAGGGNTVKYSGSSYGGYGGKIIVSISVTPGEILQMNVGGQGGSSAVGVQGGSSVGGVNGGGAGALDGINPGGGGGGASDIRRSPYALANRVVVAGGGGGSYVGYNADGGNGGYPTGGSGSKGTSTVSNIYPPTGGTASAGGTTTNVNQYYCYAVGSFGSGASVCDNHGAGGGGGWWGGGHSYATSGGGGSSYVAGGVTLVSHGTASAVSHGSIILTYINLDPTASPTKYPTPAPTAPTLQPTAKPSVRPSGQPTRQPTTQPTQQPSSQPTCQPSSQPTRQPSTQPTRQPSTQPTSQPSTQPTRQPSSQPTRQPYSQPTGQPSSQPTRQPYSQPTGQPSLQPTGQPSSQPTRQPSSQPTRQPYSRPSGQPTIQPSRQPAGQPSRQPSAQPTSQPTSQPTGQPVSKPSGQPTAQPTRQPLSQPTVQPSIMPTGQPSSQPSGQPTMQPFAHPSIQPTIQPSAQPTLQPSAQPSQQPTTQPSVQPSRQPTKQPTSQPAARPSQQPSSQPSVCPTGTPSSQPSAQLTNTPSVVPSGQPTAPPSVYPTVQPSVQPSSHPTSIPSVVPSGKPSLVPSGKPSSKPSCQPTTLPSTQPSSKPSTQTTNTPSAQPSMQPVTHPSSQPSRIPSAQPTRQPTSQPLNVPTSQPSVTPTLVPTLILTTDEYVYIVSPSYANSIDSSVYINGTDWACGNTNSEGSVCLAVDAPGVLRLRTWWEHSYVTSILQTPGDSGIYFSRTISTYTENAVYTSEVAQCTIADEGLTCTTVTFPGIAFVAGSYASAVDKLVYIGANTLSTTITIMNADMTDINSYALSSVAVPRIVLNRVLSPPNFIGSFVAGTCETIGSVVCIFAGMVRSDSGAMTAMYVTPVNSALVSSTELVNAMALEYTQPHSYIAGGYPVPIKGNYVAYVLCVNSIHHRVQFGMQYRVRLPVTNNRRRLDESFAAHCIVESLLILDNVLYVLVNWNTSTLNNRVSLLMTDMTSGDILHQVHIVSTAANLYCDTMHARVASLAIACVVVDTVTNLSSSLLLSASKTMTFAVLPSGIIKSVNETFYAESIAFRTTQLPITVRATNVNTVVSDVTNSFTMEPTLGTTLAPSLPLSATPSAQPSSSPTAAPSMSPQPTSQPSSSGPTNTYKPTIKPSLSPTRVPTTTPTRSPTVRPTNEPTARPSAQSSRHPTTQPSVAPTNKPTSAPQNKPTGTPTITPSLLSTGVPSVLNTTQADNTNQEVSQAAFIFIYVLGGLALVWVLYRVLLCYVASLQSYEMERKKLAHLDTMQRLFADKTKDGALPTSRVQSPRLVGRVPQVGANCNINKSHSRQSSQASSVVLSSLHSSERSDISYRMYSDESYHSSYSWQFSNYSSGSYQPSRSEESIMEEGGTGSENQSFSEGSGASYV